MTMHFPKLETKSAPDPLTDIQATLAEIQRKAAGAAAVGEKLDGLSSMLSDVGRRVEQMEIRAARPGMGAQSGAGGAFQSPDDRQHLDLFTKMLRNPKSQQVKADLAELEQKTASGATGAAGGFAIPSVLMTPLERRIANGNPFRGLVRGVTVNTRDVSFPLSNGNSTTGWVGENASRPATTEATLIAPKPTFGTLYALVDASEELVMDAAFDVASWFVAEAGDAMGDAEATAIVSGNGTDKPTGLLNTAPQSGADGSRTNNAFRYLPTGAASTLGTAPADLLVSLVYDLKAGYRQRAVWAMNSQVAGEIRKLKDTTGRFLWADSLAPGQPATLLGYPVVIAETMPGVGANTHPIAFGDFERGYILADNGGLRVTVDDNVTVPGKIRWYIRKRVGGVAFNNEAIRFLKVATS